MDFSDCDSFINLKRQKSYYIIKFLIHIFNIMGRPSTKPKDLRDGYYLEVRNKNQKTGVKIRRDTRSQLLRAIDEYKESKDVVILGKSENGKMKDIPELDLVL